MDDTRTVIEVSRATYEEIREALNDMASDEDSHLYAGDIMDLQGLALKLSPADEDAIFWEQN